MHKETGKSNLLNVALIVLAGLILATIIFAFPFVRGESAFAAGEDEENEVRIFVDGVETDEVYLERGSSAAIVVLYGGETYVPFLAAGTGEYKLLINNNRVTVATDSVVGGSVDLYLSIVVDDEIVELSETVTLYPRIEETVFVEHRMTEEYGYRVYGDFSAVRLRVRMGNQSVDVTVRSGEGIENVLASSGRDSYGNIIIDPLYVVLSGYDGQGNEREMIVDVSEEEDFDTNSVFTRGNGTQSNPYLISSSSSFATIHNYDSSSNTIYFRQSANFSYSGNVTFSTKTFYGEYDGYNYTITRSGTLYFGFCRQNNGTIKNLTIEFNDTNFSYFVTGGVVAYNDGTIQNCTVTTDPTNYTITINMMPFGGIAMMNSEGALIKSCTVTLYLRATSEVTSVGGIAANNYGEIKHCVVNQLSVFVHTYTSCVVAGICANNQSSGEITGTTTVNVLSDVLKVHVWFDDVTNYSGIQPVIAAGIGKNYASASHYAVLAINLNGTIQHPKDFSRDQNVHKQVGNQANIDDTYINKIVGQNNWQNNY